MKQISAWLSDEEVKVYQLIPYKERSRVLNKYLSDIIEEYNEKKTIDVPSSIVTLQAREKRLPLRIEEDVSSGIAIICEELKIKQEDLVRIIIKKISIDYNYSKDD